MDELEPHEIGEDDLGLLPLPTKEEVEGLEEDIVPKLEVLAILDRQEALFPMWGARDFLFPPKTFIGVKCAESPLGGAVKIKIKLLFNQSLATNFRSFRFMNATKTLDSGSIPSWNNQNI